MEDVLVKCSPRRIQIVRQISVSKYVKTTVYLLKLTKHLYIKK